MGDEADADWQAGLVEWGIEDTRERYRQILEKAVRTSPFRNRKPQQRRKGNDAMPPSPTPSEGEAILALADRLDAAAENAGAFMLDYGQLDLVRKALRAAAQ